MSERIDDFGNGFWHIRGEYRAGGLVNLGTHCALVRLADGNFVFLDSYTLPDPILREVEALTDGGAKIRAIVNVHPFHTLHCEWMYSAFPQATLYGTARHKRKFPDLPWHEVLCEDDALADEFDGELDFKVPDGVNLVCDDPNVHFGSVLAYHRASRTIFVDDTLSLLNAPFPLSLLPMTGRLDFHPGLAKALQDDPQAVPQFREWVMRLGTEWHDARRVAMAHNSVLDLPTADFPERLGEALGRAEPVLAKHQARIGG